MEKKKDEKIKNFSLLPNIPCGVDLFEGKSQEKTATQISNVLENDEEIKIIGIDGGWGSGKSNLVEQVKNNLKEKFHFFIYDAWGHQEDLQRRSFLEELTIDLIQEKLIPASWDEKLKKLLAKSKETVTKKVPRLSLGIILAGLSLILTPIFKELSDFVCVGWLRFIIISLPLLFLIIVFIYYFIIEPKNKNSDKLSENEKESKNIDNVGWIKKNFIRTKNAFSNLFLVYQNKLEEDTTYETISEDVPSVRNFRNWMKNISEDLNEIKLVIVFDNMDRLPKEKVKELWSSIHVFFAENENNYENIRVIVPFDRSHIQESFNSSDNINNFGDDFINKTFDVVYRVSPPILTDWKNYFNTQWTNAFGENSTKAEDYNSVLQIVDLLLGDITPRKLIAFINEFVSIKQVVRETIPNKYIALFIVGKNPISKNPIKEIVKPTYLGSLDFLYNNDEDLPKFISSLFYQIEPDKAIQVIFTERLKKILDNNDDEEIEIVSEIPDFYHVLEKSIIAITNIENSVLCLDSLPSSKIGNKGQNDLVWNCIYKMEKQKNDHILYEYQLILLGKIKNKLEYLKILLSGFVSSKEFVAKEYYQSIKKLEKEIETEIDILPYLISKETSVEDFIEFVKEAKSIYKIFKISCKENELNDFLLKLDTKDYSSIDYIQYLKNDYSLIDFSKKLNNLINENANSEDLPLISTLFRLSKNVSLDKPLSSNLTDDQIYNLFSKSKESEEFYYDLVSMRISKLDKFNPSYSSIFDNILNSDDDEIAELVAKNIEYYINYGNILLGLKSFNLPFMKLVAKKLVNKSFGKKRANLKLLLSSFDEICSSGDIHPISLIKNLNSWETEDITLDNIKNTASIFFLENALNEKSRLTSHCFDCVIKYLDSLAIEEWQVSFEDVNSYEFRACVLLDKYKIPQNAMDAIKIVLNELSEKTTELPDQDIWKELISKLDKQGRGLKSTFKNIRDNFYREDNINKELFLFFIDWLFKYADLEEKKESLRKLFKSEILRDVQSMNLILENKEIMIPIVKVAEEESTDFKDVIKELLDESTSEELKKFAKAIGIKVKSFKKDDTEQSDTDK